MIQKKILYHEFSKSCSECKANRLSWDQFGEKPNQYADIIKAYYLHETDLECLNQESCECLIDILDAVELLIESLKNHSIRDIINFITETNCINNLSSANIPQFSNLDDCIFKINDIIHLSLTTGLSYQEMGKFLRIEQRKPGADTKYGENHAKTAALIDLCLIDKKENKIIASILGTALVNMNKKERKIFTTKLFLKIPIVQKYYVEKYNDEALKNELNKFLAESTANRRFPNVKRLINEINLQLENDIF